MRSNLPAPSQPWGLDVDRRLAQLESQMALLSQGNEYNLSRIANVTKTLGGTARPSVETASDSNRSVPTSIPSYYEFCNIVFPWPPAANFAVLQVSSWGYFQGNNTTIQDSVRRGQIPEFYLCHTYPGDEVKQRIWYTYAFGGTDPDFLPVMVTAGTVTRQSQSGDIEIATALRSPNATPTMAKGDGRISFMDMRATVTFL